jgi:hypothetical protein
VISSNRDDEEDQDVWYVLKVIGGVFGGIFVLLYYCGVYFSLYDKDEPKNSG